MFKLASHLDLKKKKQKLETVPESYSKRDFRKMEDKKKKKSIQYKREHNSLVIFRKIKIYRFNYTK